MNDMKMDLISATDLSLEDIQGFLALAAKMDEMAPEEKVDLLKGRVLMVMFYEPSTRTRLSFEAAMVRLGGSVIGFSEIASTSVAKGETLRDTVLTAECYADVIVIRHPQEGAARLAAGAASVPVINAGDGANQHPTQTLLDLHTIRKNFGRTSGLRIALAGDLKYGRTVHSLFQALLKFRGNEFVLVSPPTLRLPEYLLAEARSKNIKVEVSEDLQAALHSSDLVYMTRIQRERFPDALEYAKVKDAFIIDAAMLKGAPERLKILHPLPRVNEIAPDVDGTVYAGYFPQVYNGMIMRQAILLTLLGVKV